MPTNPHWWKLKLEAVETTSDICNDTIVFVRQLSGNFSVQSNRFLFCLLTSFPCSTTLRQAVDLNVWIITDMMRIEGRINPTFFFVQLPRKINDTNKEKSTNLDEQLRKSKINESQRNSTKLLWNINGHPRTTTNNSRASTNIDEDQWQSHEHQNQKYHYAAF